MAYHPQAHLLQTGAWGDLKAKFGWRVERMVVPGPGRGVGAQILFRQAFPGFSMAYIPKGPVCSATLAFDSETLAPFWRSLDGLCRAGGAVLCKIEPDLWQERLPINDANAVDNSFSLQSTPGICPPGFMASQLTIQPRRTVVINLKGSDEQILARMKQKTRYNIRLAQRRGVQINASHDLEKFYQMMALTGKRDGFGVHSRAYFSSVFAAFQPLGLVELLDAHFNDQSLAALMVFRRGARAWYLYGASSNDHRELMAPYLVQWEAMRWAKMNGSQEYDLWGVPDASLPELEAGFMDEQKAASGLWGVYRFKRGFGGDLCRAAGPYDRVYNRLAYTAYLWRSQRSIE